MTQSGPKFLTVSLCKRLLGLAPLRQKSPPINAAVSRWEQTSGKPRRCCRHTVTMQLVRDMGEAILESTPAVKEEVLRVCGASQLIGYIRRGNGLVKLRLA